MIKRRNKESNDLEDNVKKFNQRQTLFENQFKGNLAQNIYKCEQNAMGNRIRRDPIGRDYIKTVRDPITHKYEKTLHVEVKSSQTAPLTPLQRSEKKRLGSRYKIHRQGW